MGLFNLFGGDKTSSDSKTNVVADTRTNTSTVITGVGAGITDLVQHVLDVGANMAAVNQQAALALAQYQQQQSAVARAATRVATPARAASSPSASLSTWLGIAASALTVWWFLRKGGVK